MQLLFLTHRIPYPPNKGDKIRSYNILEYLTHRHDVYLGTLIDDHSDVRFGSEIQDRVREFVFRPIHSRLKKVGALVSLLRRAPFSVAYFYSRRLQKDIDDLIRRVDFDVVLCFSSPMAEYLFRSEHWDGKLKRAVLVMDLIDVDSYKWRQYAQRSVGWKRWMYVYEARHLAYYEERIARAFDHLLVVSEQEKEIFRSQVASAEIIVMTNGVDLQFFSPMKRKSPSNESATIVFTGVMDYWPNVEGVTWFAEVIFPTIRKAVSNAVFYIVGSRPTAEVHRLEQLPGVRVTGFVDDVRDYLSVADVCVVPLRIARGIQNKVLEAMAMGRAVVGTPEALEGIRAVSGQDLMPANNAAIFADTVIELLKNRAKADAMGKSARSCVEHFYSWENNLGVLDELAQRS